MEWTLPAFLPGLSIWLAISLLPWRPCSTREKLDSQNDRQADLSDITVLIPARNEADTIAETLTLLKQGNNLNVILVDDQSEDNTAEIARSALPERLTIIAGSSPAPGWSGKLWALEQGRRHIGTEFILLLDADIALAPGIITTLLEKARNEKLQMVSLMAELKMESNWEKLLIPAFVFFFKLLYPFALSNKPDSRIAAAAGGCILLKREVLDALGGFACIKQALIDDCSLAAQIKQRGHKTWTGLTHSASSRRDYSTLNAIWLMIQRTAYIQLGCSPLLLLLCTLLMTAAFILPVVALIQGLIQGDLYLLTTGLLTLGLQTLCYLPILRYYSINPLYAPGLTLAGGLYLIMTWGSAIHYHFGKGVSWKGRYYGAG